MDKIIELLLQLEHVEQVWKKGEEYFIHIVNDFDEVFTRDEILSNQEKPKGKK